MNRQLVDEYLAAFAMANPGNTAPQVTYNRGWYRVGIYDDPVRESKLAQMRDTLLRRVAEGKPKLEGEKDGA